jgi:uncharacterized protein (TIGR02118 family)
VEAAFNGHLAMIKVIAMVKRNSALTHEQFARQWREQHAPLVRGRLPGLRKYVLNITFMEEGRGTPEWDGIVELHFDDLESRQRAFSSAEWLAAEREASSAGLLDLVNIVSVVADEYIVPLD